MTFVFTNNLIRMRSAEHAHTGDRIQSTQCNGGQKVTQAFYIIYEFVDTNIFSTEPI